MSAVVVIVAGVAVVMIWYLWEGAVRVVVRRIRGSYDDQKEAKTDVALRADDRFNHSRGLDG